MCGIAGIWNKHGQVNGDQIALLNNALEHRGPDGCGVWHNEAKELALIHRRLAILDLTDAAAQPMTYAEGRFVIVFNGEIYNFIEIKNELASKGYSFKTESD